MNGLGPVFITGVMALLGTILQMNATNWSRGNRMKNTMEVMGGLQQLISKDSENAEMKEAMERLQNTLYRDVEVAERAALRRTEDLISATIATVMGFLFVSGMVMLAINGPNDEVRTTALIGAVGLLLMFVWVVGSEWKKWHKSGEKKDSKEEDERGPEGTVEHAGDVTEPENAREDTTEPKNTQEDTTEPKNTQEDTTEPKSTQEVAVKSEK